jgi:hypothetical protein
MPPKTDEAAPTDILAEVEDNIIRMIFVVATFRYGPLPFSRGVPG